MIDHHDLQGIVNSSKTQGQKLQEIQSAGEKASGEDERQVISMYLEAVYTAEQFKRFKGTAKRIAK